MTNTPRYQQQQHQQSARFNTIQPGQAASYGRYAALVSTLVAYRACALAAAQQLHGLSYDLSLNIDKTIIKKKQLGSIISFIGLVAIFVSVFTFSYVASSPFLTAFGSWGVLCFFVGLFVTLWAVQDVQRTKARLTVEVGQVFGNLEVKVNSIQLEIQNLVVVDAPQRGSRHDNMADLDQLIGELSGEDVSTTWLKESLRQLRQAYGQVPAYWLDFGARHNLLSAWHALEPPPYVPVQQSPGAGAEAMEASAWWSVMEVKSLENRLKELGRGGALRARTALVPRWDRDSDLLQVGDTVNFFLVFLKPFLTIFVFFHLFFFAFFVIFPAKLKLKYSLANIFPQMTGFNLAINLR